MELNKSDAMSYSLQKPMQKNMFSQKAVGGEWPQCLPYLFRLTYTCSHHRYSTTGMVDRHGPVLWGGVGRRGRDDPVSVNPSTCNLPEVMVNGFRQTRPRPQLRRHSSRYTRPDRTPPFNFIIIAPPPPPHHIQRGNLPVLKPFLCTHRTFGAFIDLNVVISY